MKLIRRNIAQIIALCENALEDLLHRDVDLIEYEAIQNPYFKEEVDQTKKPIYG